MAETVRDEEFVVALKSVSRLAGWQIKKLATADDLERKTLTVTFCTPSEGLVQETLNFEEREAISYTVASNGDVHYIGAPPALDEFVEEDPHLLVGLEREREHPEGFAPNPIEPIETAAGQRR